MTTRSYAYLRPSFLNLDGSHLALMEGDLELDAGGMALVGAIMAGLGRTDALAKAACAQGGSARRWERSFVETTARSSLLALEEVPAGVWGRRCALVCDWEAAHDRPRLPSARMLVWRRPPARGRRTGFVLGRQPSLFVQAQLMRGLLGTSRRGHLVLMGNVDRILFGDLAHRHRTVVCVGQRWPEARRVWQADGSVLREDATWLEHLFYAIRHTTDDETSHLSALSGTVLAGQEVRALCDAKEVLCWNEAQKRELIRFYGRASASVTVVQPPRGDAFETEKQARRAIARCVGDVLEPVIIDPQ